MVSRRRWLSPAAMAEKLWEERVEKGMGVCCLGTVGAKPSEPLEV